MSARIYWLWLASCEGIPVRAANELLAHFGTPEQVYAADRGALTAVPSLTRAQVNALLKKNLTRAREIAEACERKHIAILTCRDAVYPDRLRSIPDPPLVLYVLGSLPDLDAAPGIAMVGTRKATPYGLATAEKLARELAEAGFVVVSGMAAGIDGAANRGALRGGGKTVAVLGCGVDRCYPAFHEALMGDIQLSGAVISEYPPGTEPLPRHFPMRNRIISGLCVGTIVVEAPKRSGALITARAALDQGRDVFAVPANLDAPGFGGSNELIANGEAALITGANDIIREYSMLLSDVPTERRAEKVLARDTGIRPSRPGSLWDKIKRSVADQAEEPAKKAAKKETQPVEKPVRAAEPVPLPEHLTAEERQLVQAVREGAGTVDDLVQATGLTASVITASITMLELDGVLTRRQGRIFAE